MRIYPRKFMKGKCKTFTSQLYKLYLKRELIEKNILFLLFQVSLLSLKFPMLIFGNNRYSKEFLTFYEGLILLYFNCIFFILLILFHPYCVRYKLYLRRNWWLFMLPPIQKNSLFHQEFYNLDGRSVMNVEMIRRSLAKQAYIPEHHLTI